MGASVKLIVEDSLRSENDGCSFAVRLNWYRSLPLSSVEIISVSINGATVQDELIYFEINDHQYSKKGLMEQFEEFWFVQDHGRVRVSGIGRLNAGETHTIETEISLRFPYMPIGGGRYLTIATKLASEQTAQ